MRRRFKLGGLAPLLVVALVFAGCHSTGGNGGNGSDGSTAADVDSGAFDAGLTDAGLTDAGHTDAGPDASVDAVSDTVDTGAGDVGAPDTWTDGATLELGPDAVQDDGSADASSSCLSPGWQSYFASRPALAAATLGRLGAAGLAQLCADLALLDGGGKLVVAEPQASKACVEPSYCPSIVPTQSERDRIQAAKYAHAVWLDAKGGVPWKLKDLSVSQLDELFDPTALFAGGVLFKYVVDHSPSDAYQYLVDQGLIKQDMLSTLVAVVDDLRTTDLEIDFVHGLKGNGHPVDTAVTVYDALKTFVKPRISRKGCHSMTRIVVALLRSVNVPGREVNGGQWYLNLHSSAQWPVVGRVLAHGDDVYSAALRAAPSAELLTPTAFYSDPANTAVCGADKGCLVGRHTALVASKHPAKYYVTRCCDPAKWNVVSCEKLMSQSFGAYLTAAELSAAVTSTKALCAP